MDKLYQEKIDSMNQNDRIEFYSVLNIFKNKVAVHRSEMLHLYVLSTLLIIIGIALAIIGFHLRVIFGYSLFLFGVASVGLSMFFLLLFCFLTTRVHKTGMEGRKELEKILERRHK